MIETRQITEEDLFLQLEGTGAPLVLTNSPRAARALRIQYDRWQVQRGKAAWPTPPVWSWDPWKHSLWDALLMAGKTTLLPLSSLQELVLWKEALQGVFPDTMLSPENLATLAQQTYHILEEHAIDRAEVKAHAFKDTAAYLRWQRAFETQCDKRGVLCPASMEKLLAQAVENGDLVPPKNIVLVGFDRTWPNQALLLHSIARAGGSVTACALVPANGPCSLPTFVEADDVEQELTTCAFWVRRQLASGRRRIGIFVPSLPALKNRVDRTFRLVLAPSSFQILSKSSGLPYEFTLGTPMDRVPEVRSALLLWEWLGSPIAFDQVSAVLLSGHFGGVPLVVGAKLDAWWKDQAPIGTGAMEISWFLDQGDRCKVTGAREYLRSLTAARDEFVQHGQKDLPFSQWCDVLRNVLARAQWSALRAVDSAGHQLLQQWEKALDEIAKLDAVSAPVRQSKFFSTLQDVLAGSVYAEESHGAPVQIMEAQEAAGLVWDAAWATGMTLEQWPQRGRANPWVPWPVQRQHAVPYADPKADLDYTYELTRRVVASASEVVFSAPLDDLTTDGAPARAVNAASRISPVLMELFPSAQDPLVRASEWLQEMAGGPWPPVKDQRVLAPDAPAAPYKGDKLRGGTSVLKAQAVCPFQAFAEFRLAPRGPESPSLGVSPARQGSILHDALRRFWTQVREQKKLLAMTPEELEIALQAALRETIEQLPSHSELATALLAVETDRAMERLREWTKVEANRTPFTVLECEKVLQDVPIGGLKIDCRTDRIDQTPMGLAVLDYKTGAVSLPKCKGDRPEEPQLLVYAIALQKQWGEKLAGAAYAGLRGGAVDLKPLACLHGTFTDDAPKRNGPVPVEELSRMVAEWERALEALVREFQQGEASVRPKSQNVCRYCAYPLLCRVAETGPSSDEDEDDAEDETADTA